MYDPTNTVSYEYFNTSVRGWAKAVRSEMVANARTEKVKHAKKDSPKRKMMKLAKSVSVGFRKSYGMINRISFSFARHGEFIHYGVGRGYVREGGTTVRGKKYTDEEFGRIGWRLLKRGYTAREIRKMRFRTGGEMNRQPIDWFDGEIRNRMQYLAEYAGDACGDSAMNALLEKMDKPLPVFTKSVKVRQKKQ